MIREPEEARAQHLLQIPPRKVPFREAQHAQRELQRRRRQSRAAATLAPGNAQPFEGRGNFLGNAATEASRRDGDAVRRRSAGDQIGAPARHLARLCGRRRAGKELHRCVARRRSSAEQRVDERRERRRLGGVEQLQFWRGLRPAQRLEGAQRRLDGLAQISGCGPRQPYANAQPPRQRADHSHAQRRPIEHGVEGHPAHAPQGDGQRAAVFDRFDGEVQRPVRVGQAAAVERQSRLDQDARKGSDPFTHRLRQLEAEQLRRLEQPLP